MAPGAVLLVSRLSRLRLGRGVNTGRCRLSVLAARRTDCHSDEDGRREEEEWPHALHVQLLMTDILLHTPPREHAKRRARTLCAIACRPRCRGMRREATPIRAGCLRRCR